MSKVILVPQVPRGSLAPKGPLDRQGHRECQVQLGFLVTQGEMDFLGLMVQQDEKEREGFQASQVQEEYKVLLVLMAYKALLVLLEQLLLLMDSS